MRQILLFVIVAFLFSSCQPTPRKDRQSLRINIGEEPQTLDPRKARDIKDQTLMRMLFEGLTRVNKEEKIELALAESYQISQDLKTYTFIVRPAKWTNGDAVLAEDFVFAWKKILDPSFPSDYAAQLYVIKNAKGAKQGKLDLSTVGVEAINSKTLKVELENPTPYFLELLASPCFFPIHQKNDQQHPKWAGDPSQYVSNGPFSFSEWKHQDFLKLKKNPSYWDHSSVFLNEIELVMVTEETELGMFEKEELDWAGSPLSILSVDALNTLREKNLLHTQPILGTHFLRANVERAPFQHPWIRWAFALGIHRQSIIDHILQGNQVAATGLVPPVMNLQKEPFFKDGDASMAKALFETAKKELELSKMPEIILTYTMNERNHLIAQAVQQQWYQAFGIRIHLEGVERKIYFDRISKQDYQLSIGSWVADFNDPVNFLENFKYRTTGTNNTRWENPQYIQILDHSFAANDENKRKELLSRGERILIDEMPVIPIFHYTLLYVKNKKLHDVVLTSMGNIDFKWARFDD
jgi:oligopeptide transport system substrate-binding protein